MNNIHIEILTNPF